MDAREQRLFERLTRRSPEDNFVERKPQSVKADELRRTLVAFSNSLQEQETAVLFIGVDDRTGKIVGVDNTDALEKRVAEAGEGCYPLIRSRMTVLQVETKRVLAVEVGFSRDKPHFARLAYVRSGSRSVKASDSLYGDLLTSHCTIAGELLKWKDKVVTVRLVNKKLGNNNPEWDPSINGTRECRVLRCDPFSVTLYELGSMGEYTEPLSRLDLDWDQVRNRRLVIVRGTPLIRAQPVGQQQPEILINEVPPAHLPSIRVPRVWCAMNAAHHGCLNILGSISFGFSVERYRVLAGLHVCLDERGKIHGNQVVICGWASTVHR